MTEDQKRVELLPCPFCGCKDIDLRGVIIDKQYFKSNLERRYVCRNCDAIGPMECTIDWNTRKTGGRDGKINDGGETSEDLEFLLDLMTESLKFRYNEKNPEAAGYIAGQIIKAGFRREANNAK